MHAIERMTRFPMKVLFVFSIGRMTGGAANVWLSLLDGLSARGVEPCVVIPGDVDGTMVAELERRGIPWKAAFFTWWVTADPDPRSLRRRLCRAAARAVNARAEHLIGSFIDEQRADLVYICDGTVTAGLHTAKKRGLPVVWHMHQQVGGDADISYIDSDGQVGRELSRADAVIAVSRSIGDGLRTRFSACPKVHVVPNGIPVERTCSAGGVLEGDEVRFSFVGRFDGNKRPGDALRAFCAIAPDFPEARLCLVGTGDEGLLARLKREAAADAAAARIEFPGFCSDMPGVWARTDVALNCSMSEGCSMVMAEALASGRLVLCSDAPGNVELVPSSCGLLYARGDADALAGRMRWVLEHRDEARALAAAGKARAEQVLSVDAQMDAVLSVFKGVLS